MKQSEIKSEHWYKGETKWAGKYDFTKSIQEDVDNAVLEIREANLLFQWDIMEDMQDFSPYMEFGWYGFVPLIIYRTGTN